METASAPIPPLPALCWHCARVIDPFDRYCRHCGRGQGDYIPWYYQPWGIAVATVLGLGPFGVFLVWRSPKLSTPARWAWTAAIAGVTVWVGWRLYQLMLMMTAALNFALKGF